MEVVEAKRDCASEERKSFSLFHMFCFLTRVPNSLDVRENHAGMPLVFAMVALSFFILLLVTNTSAFHAERM